MTCYESPNIEPGETWSSFHANITLHSVIDGTHADITVLPYQGDADRFTITEDLSYEYPDAVRPFNLVMQTIIAGTDTEGVVKCVTCDIEGNGDVIPDDLLGLLIYVKDKIVELHMWIGDVVPNIIDIIGYIQTILIKIDETKNMIIGIVSNINYEFDVFEIWMNDKFEYMIDTITVKLTTSINDVFDSLDIISLSHLRQIRDEIVSEIQKLSMNIADEIIIKVWDYIESKLFKEEP